MGNTQRLRKRKIWLYNQNKYCPLCNVLMILPEVGGKYGNLPNTATIDHLNDRYDLEKRLKRQTYAEKLAASKRRAGRTRLICRKCNGDLAEKRTKELSKWELWKRGRFPRYLFFMKLFYKHEKNKTKPTSRYKI